MSDDAKDWKDDANQYKKALFDDFKKDNPHGTKKEFLSYLMSRLYNVGFPTQKEKDEEWAKQRRY